MSNRVQAIVEEVWELTPQERQELLDLLKPAFSAEPTRAADPEEAAWLQEVERRISQAVSSGTKLTDVTEVVSRARRLQR